MPVYNGERTIADAIGSILAQSFTDFELLILDDASTDGTDAILAQFNDPRLRVIRNSHNLKIVRTLNQGLDLAQGDYIARMDADDISLKDRFEIQNAYLDAHPEIGIVGSHIEMFGECPSHIHLCPETHEAIVAHSFFQNPMAHPSVMMRRSALAGAHYSEDYPFAEDWEFWRRLSTSTRLANLQQALVKYRVSAPSAPSPEAGLGKERVLRENAAALGLSARDRQMYALLADHNIPSLESLTDMEAFLRNARSRNDELRLYPKKEFNLEIGQQWLLCCRTIWSSDPRGWKVFLRSPLHKLGGMTRKEIWRIRIRRNLGQLRRKVALRSRLRSALRFLVRFIYFPIRVLLYFIRFPMRVVRYLRRRAALRTRITRLLRHVLNRPS